MPWMVGANMASNHRKCCCEYDTYRPPSQYTWQDRYLKYSATSTTLQNLVLQRYTDLSGQENSNTVYIAYKAGSLNKPDYDLYYGVKEAEPAVAKQYTQLDAHTGTDANIIGFCNKPQSLDPGDPVPSFMPGYNLGHKYLPGDKVDGVRTINTTIDLITDSNNTKYVVFRDINNSHDAYCYQAINDASAFTLQAATQITRENKTLTSSEQEYFTYWDEYNNGYYTRIPIYKTQFGDPVYKIKIGSEIVQNNNLPSDIPTTKNLTFTYSVQSNSWVSYTEPLIGSVSAPIVSFYMISDNPLYYGYRFLFVSNNNTNYLSQTGGTLNYHLVGISGSYFQDMSPIDISTKRKLATSCMFVPYSVTSDINKIVYDGTWS